MHGTPSRLDLGYWDCLAINKHAEQKEYVCWKQRTNWVDCVSVV
jgi:hypothetical protein